jgi:hypothetical protein
MAPGGTVPPEGIIAWKIGDDRRSTGEYSANEWYDGSPSSSADLPLSAARGDDEELHGTYSCPNCDTRLAGEQRYKINSFEWLFPLLVKHLYSPWRLSVDTSDTS